MKLQNILSVALALSTASAFPLRKLFGGEEPEFGGALAFNESSNSTTVLFNGTSTDESAITVIAVVGGNNTNSTGGFLNTTVPQGVLSSLPQLIGTLNATDGVTLSVFNQLAGLINETVQQDFFQGLVVVADADKIASLSFFNSIVFEGDKPLVVATKAEFGIAVVLSEGSANRGALAVTEAKVIYQGIFAPQGNAPFGGSPIGVVTETDVVWFTEPSLPVLIGDNSTIRTNFTNFTSPFSIVSSRMPVVPIVIDGFFPTNLFNFEGGDIDGLVVVTDVDRNVTNSPFVNLSIPIVFSSARAPLEILDQGVVPVNTTSAGYLSPLQAKILLSIAVANNVTSPTDLKAIFP